MELIRPMYYVREEDIIRWKNRNKLDFLNCACRFTEENYSKGDNDSGESKRKEMKILISKLKEKYENIDINIFRSMQNINLDTVISYIKNGETHSFLDEYNKK